MRFGVQTIIAQYSRSARRGSKFRYGITCRNTRLKTAVSASIPRRSACYHRQ
jgi:hypothetical protein